VPEITNVRPAGDENQVVTVTGGRGIYRRSPCGGCPWRVDQTGSFPAEAFVHSAETAADMSGKTFACHEAGTEDPMICAGFLLRGAYHNLAVRMRSASGAIDLAAVHDGGHELYPGYISMAMANGVRRGELLDCRWSPDEAAELDDEEGQE
jgi:hypothetical protein